MYGFCATGKLSRCLSPFQSVKFCLCLCCSSRRLPGVLHACLQTSIKFLQLCPHLQLHLSVWVYVPWGYEKISIELFCAIRFIPLHCFLWFFMQDLNGRRLSYHSFRNFRWIWQDLIHLGLVVGHFKYFCVS